jgi:prepilin-type N-terminal cleavage/methylation domain-containing protein
MIFKRGASGFTLVELLVVITIVMILLSVSIVFLGGMSGSAVKSSARIVQSVFMRTAQYATTQRVMFFIVFDKDKSFMSVYEDSDEDGQFSKSKDALVGEVVALSKGVSFSAQPPLFKSAEPYVGFKSNGSLVLPEGVPDLSMGDNPAEEADIILEQKNKLGKMYLDFTVMTGRIVRSVYRED